MPETAEHKNKLRSAPAKTLITRTKSSAWFGAEYNMNIYRGCTHGCIYCDSRSSCYRNPEFETVKAKENALAILESELSGKRSRGVIATGSMSDPYNPFEKEAELTRKSLALIKKYGYGVAIATKGTLVARDIDLLLAISKNAPVIVKITITCADDETAKKIEPGAPSSTERFAALKELSDAGLFAGVLLMPLMPYINDTTENLAGIIEQAKASGASFIFAGMALSMRDGQREYLYQKLDENFPGVKAKYIKRYGTNYICPSPNAAALQRFFFSECQKRDILYEMQKINRAYRGQYDNRQTKLF
ncbi:radical SAM protein [Synergistaceae bacterium OttesenSCG-928-D05]|nr:radical SAM protein [Synergistaceae bacterium OttesenSCG-928-D05]